MGWRNDWLWILPPDSSVEDVERRLKLIRTSVWRRLLRRWHDRLGNIR